MPIDKIFRF